MKGHTNNPNGRPKGKPNKLTAELRQLLKNTLAGELEQIPKLLSELPARERLDMLVRLLPFIVPKMDAAAWHVGEPSIVADPFDLGW